VKESGNGTSSTDAGASLCEPVKPINVVWTSYATFNPDGPGTLKVLSPRGSHSPTTIVVHRPHSSVCA
jgi:hypothetical protein